MKYLGLKMEYPKLTATEYAKVKISREMANVKSILLGKSSVGEIVWCKFDKERFDKKLKKEIKKMFGKELDLQPYWEDFFIHNPNLYMQQEFMEYTYGEKIRMFWRYRDYGAIIFYANAKGINPNASKELIVRWFYSVVYNNYVLKANRHRILFVFGNKPFELYVRWKPIADASIHFDENTTYQEIKEQIRNNIIVNGVNNARAVL